MSYEQVPSELDLSREPLLSIATSSSEQPLSWTRWCALKATQYFPISWILAGTAGFTEWSQDVYNFMVSFGLVPCSENTEEQEKNFKILYFALLAFWGILYISGGYLAQYHKTEEFLENYSKGNHVKKSGFSFPRLNGFLQTVQAFSVGWNFGGLISPMTTASSGSLMCLEENVDYTLAQAAIRVAGGLVGVALAAPQLVSFFVKKIKPLYGVPVTALTYSIYKVAALIFPSVRQALKIGYSQDKTTFNLIIVTAIAVAIARFNIYYDSNKKTTIEIKFNLPENDEILKELDRKISSLETHLTTAQTGSSRFNAILCTIKKTKEQRELELKKAEYITILTNEYVENEMLKEMAGVTDSRAKAFFKFLIVTLGSVSYAYLTLQSFLAMSVSLPVPDQNKVWEAAEYLISGVSGIERSFRFLLALHGAKTVGADGYKVSREKCLEEIQKISPSSRYESEA